MLQVCSYKELRDFFYFSNEIIFQKFYIEILEVIIILYSYCFR